MEVKTFEYPVVVEIVTSRISHNGERHFYKETKAINVSMPYGACMSDNVVYNAIHEIAFIKARKMERLYSNKTVHSVARANTFQYIENPYLK